MKKLICSLFLVLASAASADSQFINLAPGSSITVLPQVATSVSCAGDADRKYSCACDVQYGPPPGGGSYGFNWSLNALVFSPSTGLKKSPIDSGFTFKNEDSAAACNKRKLEISFCS